MSAVDVDRLIVGFESAAGFPTASVAASKFVLPLFNVDDAWGTVVPAIVGGIIPDVVYGEQTRLCCM